VQPAALTADAVELRQLDSRPCTSQYSDVSQQRPSTSKLNLSSQLLGCSSSSHSLVCYCNDDVDNFDNGDEDFYVNENDDIFDTEQWQW